MIMLGCSMSEATRIGAGTINAAVASYVGAVNVALADATAAATTASSVPVFVGVNVADPLPETGAVSRSADPVNVAVANVAVPSDVGDEVIKSAVASNTGAVNVADPVPAAAAVSSAADPLKITLA